MNTLAPLFRHSVGFDRFDDWLETALRSDQSNGYPPYDIIRDSDGTYRVVMAVAGFSRADLDITVQENLLRISGKPKKTASSAPGCIGASPAAVSNAASGSPTTFRWRARPWKTAC